MSQNIEKAPTVAAADALRESQQLAKDSFVRLSETEARLNKARLQSQDVSRNTAESILSPDAS